MFQVSLDESPNSARPAPSVAGFFVRARRDPLGGAEAETANRMRYLNTATAKAFHGLRFSLRGVQRLP
ncbi:protein of unknown function [Methylorubrum extorquens]|uniref:Uncharacterized protein n=1 Tax=Methylorubrum extorquens TaxID=408 RepID=A0A2N9AR75_METEX|nr:protein of unknown function [Methylorubrum extorquens]